MKVKRPPLLMWLAAAIFIASLAGCIYTIVVALQHPDEAIAVGESLLNMPLTQR